MAASAFGFSFVSILNSVRKALREIGGARKDFRNVSTELEQLGVLLEQLHRGTWDEGGDAGHLNAAKGMALAVRVPLQEFLEKIEKYRLVRTDVGGIKDKLKRKAREAQWAIQMKGEIEKFRAVVVAKIMRSICLPSSIWCRYYSIRSWRMLKENRSTTLEIDTRTKSIKAACAAHRSAADQSTEEVRKIREAQVAVNESVSQLVKKCAGINVGIEDARTILEAQHLNISRRLNSVQRA